MRSAVRSGGGGSPFSSTERSSSAQTGQRLPVVASRTMTGEVLFRLRLMLMFVGGWVLVNASGLSIPATWVTIWEPGLNPSSRFQSVGSGGAPAELRGGASGLTLSGSPVAVPASAAVTSSVGHG